MALEIKKRGSFETLSLDDLALSTGANGGDSTHDYGLISYMGNEANITCELFVDNVSVGKITKEPNDSSEAERKFVSIRLGDSTNVPTEQSGANNSNALIHYEIQTAVDGEIRAEDQARLRLEVAYHGQADNESRFQNLSGAGSFVRVSDGAGKIQYSLGFKNAGGGGGG